MDSVNDTPIETKHNSSNKSKIIKNSENIISIICACLVLVVAAISIWQFIYNTRFPEKTSTYEDVTDLIQDYSLDETYHYVSNINYDDYLRTITIDNPNTYYASQNGVLESNSAMQNREALASLVEQASSSKGVIVVDGIYKTAPVELKNDVTVLIQEGCALTSVTYEESQLCGLQFNEFEDGQGLLYAKDAHNIVIVGPGTLNGNGVTYTKEPSNNTPFMPLEEFNLKTRVLKARERLREAKTSNRSSLIAFDNCENVIISSIRFFESASWTCKIVNSNNVDIENCVIDNNIHVANADGFDIVSSQDVNVNHCFVATADDGLCVKANGSEESRNIKFNKCTVLSMANCFKIGTETSKDISDISCTNCYFFVDTIVGGYSGIAIESADGSNIKNVTVDNIVMKGVSSPLLIWLGNRLDEDKGSNGTMGSINGVSITNVKATDIEMASAITGCVSNGTNCYVKNVYLANINASYRDTDEALNVGEADYEPSMSDYPEIVRVLHQYLLSQSMSIYYDLPVYGLFCRHVDGITINNYYVKARKCSTLYKDNITKNRDRYDTLNVSIK